MKFRNIKTENHSPRGLMTWVKAVCLVGGVITAGSALAAGTVAGQTIQNTALASYEDANGNSFESTSNTATIKVAEVYAASVEFDRDVVGAPGSVVYFPHVIRNDGNGTDVYTLTVTQGNTDETAAATQADCSAFEVYEDQNGNGVADSGEPVIGSGGTVSIDADEAIDVVVSCQIAGTVAPGSVIGLTLAVEASRDGLNTPDGDPSNDQLDATTTGASVDDLTAGNGDDTLEGTNEDTVTVSGDAVVKVTKQATYNNGGTANDLSDDTVEYYIEVRNNGVSAAYNVEISDVLDAATHDLSGGVASITGLTVTGAFADGAGASEGTSADWTAGVLCPVTADGTACTPAAGGVAGNTVIATNDANGDGTIGDIGVRGHDDVLPANTTLTIRFSAPVLDSLEAGTDIDNTVAVTADVDDDGDADDPVSETLTADATSEVPAVYAVDAADTGDEGGDAGTDPGDPVDGVVNDGGDDDQVINDIQTVDSVPSGATVLFNNIITNNGNTIDTLELTVNPGNFPAGTVFILYDGSNSGLLSDTNLNGDVDTGPLDPGEGFPIVVRANLPDGFADNTNAPFDAIITATSAGAALDGLSITDTKTERLNNILAPAVDLANAAADNDALTDQHDYVQGTNAATTTVSTLPGTIATFSLTVQNDSGSPDSFDLFAGGSFITGTSSLGMLPSGWTAVFRNGSGSVTTSSTTIPAGGSESFTAEVSVPSNVSLALANNTPGLDVDDLDADGDQTTGRDVVDFNGDSDADYAIFFMAKSSNSGSFDVKLDGVDVLEQEDVTMVSDNTGQVAAGGSIDYPHILRNEGNTVETVVLSSTNSDGGWGNGLVVDTDGDGVPDTIANSTITQLFIDNDNNPATPPIARAVTVDANGNITIVLNPNETLVFNDRVFAPSDAAANEANTTTITAAYNSGADTVVNKDLTKVVPGQLRLRKFSSLDAACDGTPDDTYAVSAVSDVEPQQCVCWLIVATNSGSSLIDNVVVKDAAPTFTDYLPGSLASCAGDQSPDVGGTPCATGLLANSDADDNDVNGDGYSGFHDGTGNVRFLVGSAGTDGVTPNGGALAGGDAASVQFCTTVQ